MRRLRHTTPRPLSTSLLLCAALSLGLTACAGDDPKASEPKASGSESPSPSPAGDGIPAAYFGVHDHEPIGDAANGWPDAPVGSVRAWDAGVTWRDIEIADGQYNFDRLDTIVDTAEKNDADVLLVLGQTPVFHAKDPAAESFYGEGASSPPDLDAWTAYVKAVAERYADKPVILQVWNEANVDGFWSGSPVEMAKLTKATYDAIQDVSPKPTLVSPALVTRLPSQQKWLERFYGSTVEGQSVGEFFDVVSLQLYPKADGTPETSMEILADMRAVLTENGVDKPIWNTEINYGLTGLEVPPAPKDEQVMNVVATYLLNAANDVERVYWYGWDQQSNVGTLLVEPDGATLTPAGKAFRTVHEWLVGSTDVTCEQDAQGTWTCVLQHPEGERTVYWNPQTTASVTLPDGTSTTQQVGGKSQDAEGGQQIQVGRLPVMAQAS